MRDFDANAFPLEPGIRLLEASAGTGKTFALAHLVLRYIGEAGLRLGQLLVVTYTEAAAAELRDRIGRRLQHALAALDPGRSPADPDSTLAAWLARQGQNPAAGEELRVRLLLALEELDSADITTIHGFCRRSLQRQALEAGLPPELQLDEADATLLRQVLHDYWQQQVLPLPPHLLAGVLQQIQAPQQLERLLIQLDGDPALGLDPLPADLALDQPLAARLEALWQRSWQRFTALWQEHGQALEADLCAAAAQWRSLGARDTKPYSPKPRKDRCSLLSAWIRTQSPEGDHAATVRQDLLRSYFHPGAFLKVARPLEGGAGDAPSLPQRELLEAIAAVVEGPAEALLLHGCHWGRQELARRRRQAGRLGFSQLLEAMDPGDATTTPLLAAVGERYAVALIDEFQDTDPIQWRILSRAFQPQRHRLVMVGDPKQAIYRFRGGELATYLEARHSAEAGGGVSSLGDNHRSGAELIKALNGLMGPGLRRSGLEVPPVRARAVLQPLPLPPAALARPLELVWLGADRAAGTKPPSRTALEQRLPPLVAAHCLELLEQGLSPSQLCLLVSRHHQAEALRGALEGCGIASRLVSKGDVFASAGATALQRFLDALATPASGERLRLLAASPLLGWDAARIATAAADAWSDLSGELARHAAELPRRGLLGVLGSLLDQRGLAQLALGGRLLADLQQAAELVQERLHADQLGPAAAADWLRQLRHDPDRDVPEAHQLHSDVEDAAVAVVTVHRSKGLEYPVVLCPYLWQGASSGGQRRLGSRWQPPGPNGPRLDLHLQGHWGAGHQARQQQRLAELAELERLAYVALTRAQQRLVLFWGPAQGQQGNPLHGWLFSGDGPSDPDHDPYAERGDAGWFALLEQEISARRLPVALRQPADPGGPARWRPPVPTARLELGPIPQTRFDSSWGRSSYTSWTRGSHSAGPESLEEGRETDALASGMPAAVDAPGLFTDGESPWPRQGPLADFPRGAGAGDCLHRILEQLDTCQSTSSQSALLQRELQRAGIAADQLDPLTEALELLRLTPFDGPLDGFQLSRLSREQRLNELNFDLPLPQLVRANDLAAAFAANPHPGTDGSAYATSLAALPIASRGFLTGSIDLVFCHRQRWWVVDWKSNWLGERDGNGQPLACGPRHYTAEAMAELMAANHYPLQAHLYLVALHRYLQWRLPGYVPEHHLGGYGYVFVRGVPGPCAARPVPGLVVEQPPLARVLALHRCLGGEG